MIRQSLFLLVFFTLLPTVAISAFAGVLIYKWLEYLPPAHTYLATFLPGNLSFVTGALTFLMWLFKEDKSFPRPASLLVLLIALLVWMNITSLFALAPDAAAFKWDRTVKVLGFAILTAQMLRTRERLEAFVWVVVLCVAYHAVPGAIKFVVSGGSGQVGSGLLVVGDVGSFIGDRVAFAVALPMILPFALYLGRHATLLPRSRYLRPGMLGIAFLMGVALVGTYARTAIFSGGALAIMLLGGAKRKIIALFAAGLIGLLFYNFAPGNWASRMDSIIQYEEDASASGRIVAWRWAWNVALENPIVGGGFRVFVLNAGLIPERGGYVEAHNIYFEMVAEHGFVGLALFCCILVQGYRACSKIRRRARGVDDLAWAADFARAAQTGIVVFAVGGNFVSIATSPFLYDLIAIVIGVGSVVERELVKHAANSGARQTPGLPRLHPADSAVSASRRATN